MNRNDMRFCLMLSALVSVFATGDAWATADGVWIVDKCNGNVGTNYSNNTVVNAFCSDANNSCSSSSTSVYNMIDNSEYQIGGDGCGVFNIYTRANSSSTNAISRGRYLLCFGSAARTPTNGTSPCSYYNSTTTNHCNSGYDLTNYISNRNLLLSSYGVPNIGQAYSISASTSFYNCCQSCIGRTGLWYSNTSGHYDYGNHRRFCAVSNFSCATYGGTQESQGQMRCSVGYYSAAGYTVIEGTQGYSTLQCTACPAGTYQDTAGSTGCKNIAAGYYSSATAVTVSTGSGKINAGYYSTCGATKKNPGSSSGCVSGCSCGYCPNTTRSYEYGPAFNSDWMDFPLSTTSASGATSIEACYAESGSGHYDDTGYFDLDDKCYYDEQASDNLL